MRQQIRILCAIGAVVSLSGAVHASDYYVSKDGNDGHSGSIERPLATLRAAAAKLEPGDTCFIRAGRYHQLLELDGLIGTEAAPIVFRAYEDEQVVLDGTAPIRGTWSKGKNGIYSAQVDQDMWQLFSEQSILDLARWPNASIADGSVWDAHASMRSTDRNWINKLGRSDSVTQLGVIFDENHDDVHEGINSQTMAETGVDFTGAVAVLNTGHWLTWSRPILSHEAGSNEFTYNPDGTRMLKFIEYYILGLPALDAANEWWFDADSKTVYYKPEKGVEPSSLKLRGKVRDFNLLAKNCEYVQFIGVDFFATTFGLTNCSNMLIRDSQLLYPSTHKFMLGQFDWVHPRSTDSANNTMTFIYNSEEGVFNNVVRDCRIEYPNTPAIAINSPGSMLDNCYLHDIEWDVNSSGGSGSIPGGAQTTVRRCTIHTTGASEGIRLGAGSTIEENRIYHTSLLQHDGSAINIDTPSQAGTVARRNWVYATNRQAMRFDSTTKSFGTNASVTENVFFDVEGGTGGNKFKGDYQLFAKNTAFDCFVAIPRGFGDTAVHNENSLVRNNLVDWLVEWNLKDRIEGIPAKMDHNVRGEGSVRRLLRDPDNFDFRPRQDAKELIDTGIPVRRDELAGDVIRLPELPFFGAAPDIGAYEFGAVNYWIPGCVLPQASSPVPSHGSDTVKADADLMWLHGRDAVTHNVYLAEKTDARGARPKARRYVSAKEGMTNNIFTPGALEPGKTYCWRVDAVLEDGRVIKGEVWEFKVEAPAMVSEFKQ